MLASNSSLFINSVGFSDLARRGFIGQPILDRYLQLWNKAGAATAMINWYRCVFRDALLSLAIGHFESSSRSRVPTLVLWGKRDEFLHQNLAQSSYDDGIENSVKENSKLVYLDEANHWVMHMVPDEVNKQIFLFIRENSILKSINDAVEKVVNKVDHATTKIEEKVEETGTINKLEEQVKSEAKETNKRADKELERGNIERRNIEEGVHKKINKVKKKTDKEIKAEEERKEAEEKKQKKELEMFAHNQEAVMAQIYDFEHQQTLSDKKILEETLKDNNPAVIKTVDSQKFDKEIKRESQNQELQFEHQKDLEKQQVLQDNKILQQELKIM